MSPDAAAATLASLFREGLRKSRVRDGESVVIFTDPEFAFPAYAGAALAGATHLGAEACSVTVAGPAALGSRVVRDAWRGADMVVGVSSIPWIRHPVNMDALRTGTRTLLVAEPPASLRRMFPDDVVIERTYAGARRLRLADQMRIVDEYGTELTMSKKGRKVNAQCGVSDRPGRWDQWPSAMVDSTPHEDSVEGSLVIAAGDAIFRRYVTTRVTLTVREGQIVSIEGGQEAAALREYLAAFDDPDAYRLSHVGWGTDHRADWSHIAPGRPATWACPDQEGLLGVTTIALGLNDIDFPDEFSGLDGINSTAAHLDISCRGKSILLDGELVIDRETVVDTNLLQGSDTSATSGE